jgi:hypothetical protein
MTPSACNLSLARPRRSRFAPSVDARFKDPRVEPDRNIRLRAGIPGPWPPLIGSMAARRLLAALIVASVSAGSVLAACELFCATDCARAAAHASPASCHEDAPAAPERCADRHAPRLAVVASHLTANASAGIEAAIVSLAWTAPLTRLAAGPLATLAPGVVQPPVSPPRILRV